MRPMPPNATQMTSMITMQQPVHATAAATATTTTTAATTAPAPVTTSVGAAGKQPTASSLKQQQQIAGQRTALKLSSRPPAHAQQADQQAQQQSQQQWHQPVSTRQPPVRQQSGYAHESPSLITSTGTSGVGAAIGPQHRLQQQHCPSSAALECSAISGLTTTTTTSQATGAHERSDLDPADDDPSECSCSNSFECSPDELTHSTSSHLEEPLLGAGGGGPISSQAQQPMMNHYPRAGHGQHQHRQPVQQQQQHHRNHNHHHHHHHHQDIYNQHHRQQHQPQNFQLQHPSGQQYHKSHDLGHHPPAHQQHRYHPPSAPLPPPISLYGGHNNQIQRPPQPSLPLSANNHLQQHRHRPLVPHASMPPSLSSVTRTYLGQSPPPPPPPAPLVRHSTYAATSDTITDDSLHHHHQGFMSTAVNGPTVSPPLSPSAGGSQHHGTSYLYGRGSASSNNPNTFNETEMLVGRRNGQQPKRDTLNFRRSATTREDDGNRWHRNDQQQLQQDRQQPYNYNDTMAARTLPLERHQSGMGSSSLQRSKHQRSTPRLANGHLDQPTNASNQKVSQRRHQQNMGAGNLQYQDNSQQQQHSPNPPPPPILGNDRAQSALLSSGGDLGQTNVSGAVGLNGGGGNLLLGANSAGGLPHSVSPFEAAAAFCPPILAPSASLPPIVPIAITSHRTNSPWMRLSSIILTPVGIVIVLFIVVSPLLHYLM